MFFYAITFYVNHLVLIDKYLFTKRILPFLLFNLFLISVSTFFIFEIKEFLSMFAPASTKPIPGMHAPPPVTFFIYKDTLSMFIPVIIAIALKAIESWNRNEIEKKEKERESLNTELQNLKYQLQPHFFFNSLNTVYALIENSPNLAQETVHKLSKLMRYLLYEAENERVYLKDEIQFLQQYIDLMKLRTSDKTIVKTDFESLKMDYKIAPVLFISLIENAFKHGIPAMGGSELSFSLHVINNEIVFSSENSNFPKNVSDKSGSGIGIINLKKRLNLSYPGKHSLESKIENEIYKTVLKIKLD